MFIDFEEFMLSLIFAKNYNMRLGQLARQLDIKPEKIVSYLAKEKEITIKEHPNSKVEDDLVAIITDYFKPVVEEVEAVKEKETVVEVEKEVKEEYKEPEHIETVKPEAPQGLKIVGKIDLPDKTQINVEVDGVVYDQATLDEKKKEELKVTREQKEIEKEEKRKADEERKIKAREQRAIEAERQAMLATEKSNQLSKEAEKKKEILIKAQQEHEQQLEKRRKKLQKEHYKQKHAGTTSTPSKKKIKKAVIVESSTTEQTIVKEISEPVVEVREKSAYKRFIKWLNT